MTSIIIYCNWDTNPAVLFKHDTGRIDAFEYRDDKAWHSVHPADVSTKARVVGRDLFQEMWPGLELPDASA